MEGESTKSDVGQYEACKPMPERRRRPRLTGKAEGEGEKTEEEEEARGGSEEGSGLVLIWCDEVGVLLVICCGRGGKLERF